MTGARGTYLAPEAHAYPAGGQTRKGAAVFPDGRVRRVWGGIPDTYFTIPAHARIGGRYVRGFLSFDTGNGEHESWIVFNPQAPRARREWCDSGGNLARRIPQRALAECSASGPCDAAVSHWRRVLGFTVPREPALAWLAETGAWERAELALWEPERIAETCLWLLACASRDDKGRARYLPQPLGVAL